MSLRQELSRTWRSLRRAPLFTASVVLTLTIGIGSAAAIFAIVDAVLVRPLPYGHPDRLVGLWNDMSGISLNHAGQTQSIYFAFKRFAHTLDDVALYQSGSANVADPDGRSEPQRLQMAWTTSNMIPLLQVPPMLGRSYDSTEDVPKGPQTVVISEGFWRSRFAADPGVIGRSIVIAGKSTKIIGVMPARFRFPSAHVELWQPLQLDPHSPYGGGFNYTAVARLKPGISIDAAQRDLAATLPRASEITPDLAPGVPMQTVLAQAKPIPLAIPMRTDVVGSVSSALWMVAATAALVLLVTCANVANLLLVRADGRHRELSVRAALGAGQRRVLAHFFTESALLAALSAALGLAIATLGIRLLVRIGPTQIPRLAEVRVDATVVAFTIVVSALVAIACSAIPAIRFWRGDPLAGLRDGGRSGTIGGRRQRARSALVAAQMAFALLVLAASGLLLRSFQRLRDVKPGYNTDGIATLWLTVPQQRYSNDSSVTRFYGDLTRQVAALPGVRAAGVTSRVPLGGNGMNANPMFVEGDVTTSSKIPPLLVYETTDAGYFTAMGIPLIAGRTFYPLDRQHSDEAIISQTAAVTFFHDSTGRAALNRRFRELPSEPWHTIVGVAGSVRDTSLSAPPTRVAYFPEVPNNDSIIPQLSRTMAIVARTTGDVTTTTRAMQRLVHDADPTLPTFDVRSMRETADASIARLTFTMIVLGVAAAVTLVLAVIGLYGVIAYVVTLRTRELGVRIALGAQPRSVAAMVTAQGLALCAGGVVAGLVLVALVTRFLRSLLFEIAPTDLLTLSTATALLVVFALLATWIPARRAARVNPIEALRAD
ncbi:MAG TPA: ABC transporter permease [Gemmatimonadaceae bacterium]|nr:ABC transporter permease [Gemmatimonadaceae bacterium]